MASPLIHSITDAPGRRFHLRDAPPPALTVPIARWTLMDSLPLTPEQEMWLVTQAFLDVMAEAAVPG